MDDRAAATISFVGGNSTVSYERFEKHSSIGSCSSIILSSSSSDDDCPTLLLSEKNCPRNREKWPNNGTLGPLHIDRSFASNGRDNVSASFDDERHPLPSRRLPPIPEDKLHRRNPRMVRQEIQMFDDFDPETTLADVQLSEMPGLQNKEQWKRIAGRTGQTSPPLSRQYYQTVVATIGQDDCHVPQALGPYRQPGRSPQEPGIASGTSNSPCLSSRRRFIVGSSAVVVIIAVVIAVVVTVTLARAPSQTTTDYYSGNILVQTRFLPLLANPTSTLAKNYKREFCSLIGTTLADTKTKYAVFYTTCTVTGFQNGSIIAFFTLGFTRYQNVTRLNSFLNRTLVGQQLFGGTIQAITFSLTEVTSDNNSSNDGTSNEDETINNDSPVTLNMKNETITSSTADDNDRKTLVSTTSEQQSRTTLTTVTYTTLDKAISTLEDRTTQNSSSSSASTTSLNDGTLTVSASTLTNNENLPIPSTVQTTESPIKTPVKSDDEILRTKKPPESSEKEPDSEENRRSTRPRPLSNVVKRQRRAVPALKHHRRLLQYELMPTGKVYYVDRQFYNEKTHPDKDSNVGLDTILSRSSSVDTLSDARHRHHRRRPYHHHHHPPPPPPSSRKIEMKPSAIGGRLASTTSIAHPSPFKPISAEKKRLSAFEPTRESLDRVFDVLIAAEKRREGHEYWRERFDNRPMARTLMTGRSQDIANSNTIPFLRSKQIPSSVNAVANRSQSYIAQRNSLHEATNQTGGGCLFQNSIRRRTQLLQQQQQQQRNYSPNTVYSTHYSKQQMTRSSLPITPNQQPVRILPLPNGRISRAPQARQTPDELSSVSDIWATRSSIEEDPNVKKVVPQSTQSRFQSVVNRSRTVEQRPTVNNKRPSSVDQQKYTRTHHPSSNNKTTTTKNKFFSLFKFTL